MYYTNYITEIYFSQLKLQLLQNQRTIPVIAEELGTSSYNTSTSEKRNKGAFVMDAESMDIDRLLSRSQNLAQSKGKLVTNNAYRKSSF